MNYELTTMGKCNSPSHKYIAGVDEAGRGPLAGPVVAAAVIMNDTNISEVRDSKMISAKQRESLFLKIKQNALDYKICVVSEKIIDEINIFAATQLAMKKCVEGLQFNPSLVLVDGHKIKDLKLLQKAVIKGDKKIYEIACASILAKVTRDKIMQVYDKFYPQYFFKKHKGYGTKKHFEILYSLGPCPIHRKTFFPVKEIISSLSVTRKP